MQFQIKVLILAGKYEIPEDKIIYIHNLFLILNLKKFCEQIMLEDTLLKNDI
jgi:hypothetical protein